MLCCSFTAESKANRITEYDIVEIAQVSLFDNLDSVVGLTSSTTGNKVNSYDYDPYGQMKAQIEGETNPWKYASGYLDSGTGLYHFGARYYDPSLGRWTQQDPVAGSLGDMGSANRYVYAGDDPVNLVDPSGKDFIGCFWLGVDIFLGILGGLYVTLVGIVSAIVAPNPFSVFVALLGVLIFIESVRSIIAEIQSCYGGP